MYPDTISFQRFEYPSRLPEAVQARMHAIAARIVEATGFHHGCFNVEMMYDSRSNTAAVIEMNARFCTQFSDLYEKVDGTSGYEVQLALATGRRVEFRRRQGRYSVAASFVPRTFQDQKVVRLPEPWRLAEIQRRFPESVVRVLCHEGQWLSQQPQDMTSYRYGIVNMGGRSFEELDFAFDEARHLLKFQFASRNSFMDFMPRFRA
jgi:biotin carboxylase